MCFRHWVLVSLVWESGVGMRWVWSKDSLSAPSQMQLEDEAAAKSSRAPCCLLCGGASPMHVCVCVRARTRARARVGGGVGSADNKEHAPLNGQPLLGSVN